MNADETRAAVGRWAERLTAFCDDAHDRHGAALEPLYYVLADMRRFLARRLAVRGGGGRSKTGGESSALFTSATSLASNGNPAPLVSEIEAAHRDCQLSVTERGIITTIIAAADEISVQPGHTRVLHARLPYRDFYRNVGTSKQNVRKAVARLIERHVITKNSGAGQKQADFEIELPAASLEGAQKS